MPGHFESLKQLAAGRSNLRITVLKDFTGPNNTQFCYLHPSAGPKCDAPAEKNSADPATLTAFINRSLSLGPTNHKMLVIEGHGHAIGGIAEDTTVPGLPDESDQMQPNQIRLALENVTPSLKTSKLDVLVYNTCLMGDLEVAYDASFYAKYMVAGANQLWLVNSYPYLLPQLAGTGTSDPGRVAATRVVNAYKQAIDAQAPGYSVLIAAYDLAKVSAVSQKLSLLADALQANLSSQRGAIDTVRTQVQVYDSSINKQLNPQQDAFIDIVDLASRLNKPAYGAPIQSAAAALYAAVANVGNGNLIFTRQRVSGNNGAGGVFGLNNASGLAIFFPNGSDNGYQFYMTTEYLKNIYANYIGTTHWDEFIRIYTGVGVDSNGGPIDLPGHVGRGIVLGDGSVSLRSTVFLPFVRR
jgi:Clostripain family